MGRLENKVSIITGGANGIGRSTVGVFIQEGAKVVFTDVDEKAGRDALEGMEKAGGEARFIRHDVSSPQEWEHVITETIASYGRIDILVNNAGIYHIQNIEAMSLEKFRAIQRVNVEGVFLGMKAVYPQMKAEPGGAIVNVSSVAGIIGAQGHAAYGASKGAVRIMTKDAALEFAPKGIRVNSVHPGYVRTQMAETGAEAAGTDLEGLAEGYPLKRLGRPEEVAQAILYLASEEASWITGSELVIDGGYTAQ